MNISRLNPIGYEAKTAKGNTYKKSNIGKSVFLTMGVASTVASHLSKNPLANSFSEKAFIQRLGVKNPKMIALATAGLVVAGLAVDVLVGGLFDKLINKKRAQKADNV